MTNDLTSRTINSLRFPLTVGIVFIHFNLAQIGLIVHGVEYKIDSAWYNVVVNLFSDVLPRIGVPLFFFISGFLFFNKTSLNVNSYVDKLKKRIGTLLLPFVLWNIIALVWQVLKIEINLSSFSIGELSFESIFTTLFWNWRDSNMFLSSPADVSTSTGVYPIDVPMWYLRELMIAMLFSPILYILIKKYRKIFPFFLCLLWFIFSSDIIGYFDQLLTSFFFFSWGAYYSIHKIDFVKYFQSLSFIPYICLPIAIFDSLALLASYDIFLHKVFVLLGIISVIVLFSRLLETEKLKTNNFLSNCSFFVFALHYLFIRNFAVLVFMLLGCPDSPLFMICFYFFIPIITTLICCGFFWFLNHFCPTPLRWLTGGRNFTKSK